PCTAFCFVAVASLAVLRSFPTRRSSDLGENDVIGFEAQMLTEIGDDPRQAEDQLPGARSIVLGHLAVDPGAEAQGVRARLGGGRSEEHTSELQSRFDLVCRLLLEKKNKK